jgi:hypothetical protein
MPEETLLQKQVDAVAEDQIVDTVEYIENLEQDAAFNEARALIESGEFNNFKLGGILVKINGESWTEGYNNFNEMLAAEFPTLKRRKALYLMSIYTNLVAADISWAKVGHLGWTKLKELAPILTKENVDYWVKKAEELTIIQLIEEIKKMKAKEAGEDVGGDDAEDSDKLTTSTFKVYEGQKETIKDAIEVAKGMSGTTVDSEAIANICLSFLTGEATTAPSSGPQKSLKEQVEEVGYAQALSIISDMYPQLDIKVAVSNTALSD